MAGLGGDSTLSERFICIHGHFYQPPRENPWLEEVEVQDSAHPYHDWNERITAECYARNSASHILDDQGRVWLVTNNYSRISFNFGPTLLAWLERRAPDAYEGILEADRASARHYGGHGSALAQPYNHLIMPLANQRDRRTQVLWGQADFRHRFGRDPEGMWLPETAVDLGTLEELAAAGLAFTILAPRQAARVRPLGGGQWRELGHEEIDPTQVYLVRLPSGASLAVFFYDGPVSKAVAFEGLLEQGGYFAQRLAGAFPADVREAALVHVATDGESYGHHHHNGDMALAYALQVIEEQGMARLTNYGEYLALHPPEWEVEIHENTSWSCAHGVERWRAHCGCSAGGPPEWNQGWRAPLRQTLDWLRDELADLCERRSQGLLQDVWRARDRYIEVILERSPRNIAGFLIREAGRVLSREERVRALQILEIQRHAQLMYTSCGWFFAEMSGIETVQIISYAARAAQLAKLLGWPSLEEALRAKLGRAKSNLPEKGDGRQVYDEMVRPALVELPDVAAHFGMSSLFQPPEPASCIYCFQADSRDLEIRRTGKAGLAWGRVRFTSNVTSERSDFRFAVLHLGDHNISCGVSQAGDPAAFQELAQKVEESFNQGDFTGTLRSIDDCTDRRYDLRSLFRDQQRSVLDRVLASTLEESESTQASIHALNAPLLRFLKAAGAPAPNFLYYPAELTINARLRHELAASEPDESRVEELLNEAALEGVALRADALEFSFRRSLEGLATDLNQGPHDLEKLVRLARGVRLAKRLPFEVNLRLLQNIVYRTGREQFFARNQRAKAGDQQAAEWCEALRQLGEFLRVRVE
ncbi:MAG: DUF3536 domain-containing protein [Deltaproteobacteria bacterium]|nr:DUF3536 domain-containing protein [Deltaproteobacteria bacterium]